MSRTGVLAGGIGVLALAQLGPAASSIAGVRRALLPRLAGISPRRHIALTYDDGPDVVSTPAFLALLATRRVRATFFLLGEHVVRQPELIREMADAGHELAVHGRTHTCLAVRTPGQLVGELRTVREMIEDLTGRPVTRYRPPYGVLTGEGVLATRRAGLDTVLWSAWGRDWSRHATTTSIVGTVSRSLRPGGTVLLHDSDRTSAPGSWRRTLAASARLLDHWSDLDVPVGPLCDHW